MRLFSISKSFSIGESDWNIDLIDLTKVEEVRSFDEN